MMKHILSSLACAAALCAAGPAQAALVTFDPGTSVLIDIDNATNTIRYDEAGFRFSAPEGAFLAQDGLGTAGSDALFLLAGNEIGFAAVDGSLFSLLGLDYRGDLRVNGFVGGVNTLSQALVNVDLTHFDFSPAWSSLSRVVFIVNANSVIDSINAVNAVPEPASVALAALGLLGLAAQRRRSRSSSSCAAEPADGRKLH